MQYSLTGVWQEITSNNTSQPLKNSNMNVNINAVETLKLPKNISLEVSGFYQSQRLEGIYVQQAYGSLNFGIKKKLAGNKGSLIFSANNILITQDKILYADYPERNLVTDFHINFVQRTFKLTYTRGFGNNKLK